MIAPIFGETDIYQTYSVNIVAADDLAASLPYVPCNITRTLVSVAYIRQWIGSPLVHLMPVGKLVY